MSEPAMTPDEPAADEGRLRSLLGAARGDMASLALLSFAYAAALAVTAHLVTDHVGMVRRTAELERRSRGVQDLDARLALIEKQIGLQTAEAQELAARISADVRPAAIAARIEFKAKELELALEPEPVGDGAPFSLTPPGLPPLELMRWNRTLDARGGFREFLTLLSGLESGAELVAVNAVSLRRAGKGSEVLGHAEVSIYQRAAERPGGRP